MSTKKIVYSLTYLSLNIMFAITLSLGLTSLLVYTEISFNAEESSIYHTNSFLFYMTLIVSFFLLFLTPKFLKRLTEQQLFLLCTTIFLILSIVLILSTPNTIRADAAMVFDAANKINNGNYSYLEKTEYIGVYPFQIGLVSYDRFLISIHNSPRILYFTNLLLVIGINFFSWKIVSSISLVNDNIKKVFILLSFLFLPQFFFILFGYGTIPGFFFFVLACFFTQLFLHTRKNSYLFLVLVCLSFSCILKNNYLIGAITISCILILYYLKNKSSILIIFSLLCLIIPMKSSDFIVKYYSQKSGIEISSGMPKILWITMGLQNDRSSTLEGGWYNSYSINTYTKTNFNVKTSTEIGKKDLQSELAKFKKHPKYMYSFFTKKIVSTWIEPSYQSMWSGPMLSKKKPLYYNFVLLFMHVFITLTFILSSYYYLLCSMKKIKPDIFSLFPGIYFLGGFIFHLIWETKSQYVYTYVFLLIIPATFGFINIYGNFKSFLKK